MFVRAELGGDGMIRRRLLSELGMEEDEGLPIGIDLAEVYGVQVGAMLKNNGVTAGWKPGVVSNFIPCKSDYLFELKTTANTWDKVCFYDENMSFISSNSLGTYINGIFQFGKGTSYGIPEIVKYLRAQLKGEGIGEYYIKRVE